MARRRKYRRRKKKSLLSKLTSRIIRAGFSIIVLTAFVLGIAFFTKQASLLSVDNLVSVVSPYLSEIGVKAEKKQMGQVAGKLITRVTDIGIEDSSLDNSSEGGGKQEVIRGGGEEGGKKEDTSSVESGGLLSEGSFSEREDNKTFFVVSLMADSHIAQEDKFIKNKSYLKQALELSEEQEVEKVVHTGDLTNLGVLNDLFEVKSILDSSGISYYVLPGDRDLHVSVGSDNFLKVFNKANRVFSLENKKFVLFDNSANYTLISEDQMLWFEYQIKDADFVILSQPLYTKGLALFNYLYMGNTKIPPDNKLLLEKQNLVKIQRDRLLDAVRKSDVKAVFAGDHHHFSKLQDPERSSLYHFVIGAVGETVGEYSDLDEILKEVLKPQFSLLKVYKDGSYTVDNVVLEKIE